jgi:hypothetical protein
VRIALLDANQGATVRSRSVAGDIEDDALLEQVCGLLGERCVAEESSVFASPWFWIATGAALIGGGIAIGFVVDSQRDTVFCPAGGC